MNRRDCAKGFTLIEVLVALIILAIVSLAVMKAMRDSIYDTEHVQQSFIARVVAMNVLSSMQVGLQAEPIDGSMVSGATVMLGQSWSWQAGVVEGRSNYYQRIYIDVLTNQQHFAHIEGFVIKGKTNE